MDGSGSRIALSLVLPPATAVQFIEKPGLDQYLPPISTLIAICSVDEYRILGSLCNNRSSNRVVGAYTDSHLGEENDRKNVGRKRKKRKKRRGDKRMNGKRKQPSCSMEELNPCERMRMGRQPIEGCTGIRIAYARL